MPETKPVFAQLRRGSKDVRSVVTLQVLLEEAGYLDAVDGDFGRLTDRALRRYQQDQRLRPDGIAGRNTWTSLMAKAPGVFEKMAAKWLSRADIDAAAETAQCEPAAVAAVCEVESSGCGFLGLEPRILFEGHVFWERLRKRGIDPTRRAAGNEDILYPKWTKDHYLGGARERQRLARAMAIHREAALESASWGLFQIMGHHWQSLGYGSIDGFIDCMRDCEGEQLTAFTRFINITRSRGRSLAEWLRDRNWAEFARGYNGPRYEENQYDEKLAAAYLRNCDGS